MHKILITTSSFAKYDPSLIDNIKGLNLNIVINPFARKLTESEVSDLIKQHQPVGIIAGIEPLTKNVLHKAKSLKVISRCGIGLDTVDIEAAKELGISVTNTPDAPTISVAELTLGLILTLMRRIHISDTSIRNGKWSRPMGSLLHRKTVGIIGCGRIGSKLAELLAPFECKILGYDVIQKKMRNCKMVSLDEILCDADIISLHLPYSPETHHFIDAKRIDKMKRDEILINAARGGLVDEHALYSALKGSHIAGAAIDCFEKEPYSGPLKELDNVVLTGHIGSYAREGRMLMEKQSADNLIKSLREKGVIA